MTDPMLIAAEGAYLLRHEDHTGNPGKDRTGQTIEPIKFAYAIRRVPTDELVFRFPREKEAWQCYGNLCREQRRDEQVAA